MKKLLLALMLVLTCVLLFACTTNTPQEPATGTNPPRNETQPTATEPSATEPAETQADTKAEETEPSVEETTEAVTEPVEPSPVVLYQLAPEKNSLMQSYVIKTENGKLIVIDGGIDGDGRDRAPYMPAALRAILGLKDGEYFEVEAWFLSHGHKDHMYELSKMLRDYSAESNYKINNIYFDFPEFGSQEYPAANADMEFSQIKENINKYGAAIGAEVKDGSTYYDDINGSFINSESVAKGLSLEIDGVKIEVLQTWDPADGTSNINDTSLVLRFHIGEQTVLFLNDLGSIGGRRLLATYGDQLKSDIVQMAHHGQAGVNRDVYDTIDADVHLWPTPIWVWNNANHTYQIDDVRAWLYGETFLTASEYDIVSCLYAKYPSGATLAKYWTRVLDGMKIEFPYVVPERPEKETEPETEPEVIEPVEHDYVSDGLISYYSGTQNDRDGHNKDSNKWEDLVGGHDMTITKNDHNYFTDAGLKANGSKHMFPQAIVDTVNGEAFTVELLLGDFISLGTNFNTFLNSSGDQLALFRRNNSDELELKTTGNGRIKIKGCLELLQNSLVTLTYSGSGHARIYINGELKGEITTVAGSLGAGDLFIGHSDPAKSFDTTYRSIRVYNRALTAEEVAANAAVDGFGVKDGE